MLLLKWSRFELRRLEIGWACRWRKVCTVVGGGVLFRGGCVGESYWCWKCITISGNILKLILVKSLVAKMYVFPFIFYPTQFTNWRSQSPRGLKCRFTAVHLLGSWFRFPPGVWIFVCCVCCVLSGRGLCVELITRPEESYRLWCVVVCDLETSWMRRPWPTGGCLAKKMH